MEYIAATFAFIAAVAIAHALDVRVRNKELFALNEAQRRDCIELAQACGRLMTQRQVFIAGADVDAWLAEAEWPEELELRKIQEVK